MEIRANTTLSDILTKGTAEQKAVASYFDKDNNGIIDEKEASIFNSSKIKLSSSKVSITSANGQTQVFEDMAQAKSDEYYRSGTIPVAVIDIFSGSDKMGGAAAHGNGVANLIKQHNPNIALSRYDVSPIRTFTKEQKDWLAKCEKDPKLEEETAKTPEGRNFLEKLFPPETTLKPYVVALDEAKRKMDAGEQYKAVNVSSGSACSYDDLNKICGKELGCKLTPENIAQYRGQIREILSKKIKSGELKTINDALTGEPVDARLILSIMDKIEGLGVPVYVAQSYKSKENTEQTVSLFSLSKNAITVEGGTTFDGKIQSPASSTNSLAIDPKSGKRHIEDSLTFWLGKFCRNSTSFATPIATAKSLKTDE